MNASIVLDQPANVSYTNLDQISGRVVVRVGKSADVNNIVVKLEGETRSRLLSPEGPNGERPRPQLEYHKILYQLKMVFPPPDVVESRSHTSGKAAYTLPAGQHEYPFSFKLPFNNTCYTSRSNLPNISVSTARGLEIAQPPSQHVKKLLPPTLSGFPGEAEIRYFVKATVARHSFFKENPRAYIPFNFFPLEEPRPPPTGSEVFARQRHTFGATPDGDVAKSRMKSMFGLEKKRDSTGDPPKIAVDARLPEPAILSCSGDVPLRLILKRENGSTDAVYLDSLQISLIGHTKIRAHEVYRTESNSWVIVSKSNMAVKLDVPTDSGEAENVLDDRLWRGLPLPNTVAPSFQTCNIGRTYQLDVRVGLSFNGGSGLKPQNVVLPLRLDCMVYSGITPSPALLEAIAKAKADVYTRKTSTTSAKLQSDSKRLSVPTSPTSSTQHSDAPPMPPRPGPSSQPPEYDDAPPSYEDTIASDLPPVDVPRPDYAPPPPAEDDVLRRDEKKGWV